MALSPGTRHLRGRDTGMSLEGAADSERQGKFQVTEKYYLARPAAPPRQLQRMLMHTHSRGVMLHALGAAALYRAPWEEPAGEIVVNNRPYLFGAPRPGRAQ